MLLININETIFLSIISGNLILTGFLATIEIMLLYDNKTRIVTGFDTSKSTSILSTLCFCGMNVTNYLNIFYINKHKTSYILYIRIYIECFDFKYKTYYTLYLKSTEAYSNKIFDRCKNSQRKSFTFKE